MRVMSTQRYVSPELTHFVGKGRAEDEQYAMLVKDILKSGTLVSGSRPRDDTEAWDAQVVCFCDIPVTDLEIHMKKYSRFGLSFIKRFLVDKGANPMLYVANNSPAL